MSKDKDKQENKNGSGRVVKILIAVLVALVIIIVLLLIGKCSGGAGGGTVLEPDYPSIPEETNAVPIEDDNPEERPEVEAGGGSMSISFMDTVTYSLSSGKLSLYYQNPGASTHNVVVQVILTRGEDEYLLAQSGVINPGYQVTSLSADDKVPELSEGGYDGKLRLLFYDRETGERAIVDTDIPCTVNVTK